MDATLFEADVLAKPQHLAELAHVLETSDPWRHLPETINRVIFVGMGSSHYAASVAAARIRAGGGIAVAEIASSDLLPASRPGDLVVAVSAGGGSVETHSAVEHYRGKAPIALLTNRVESDLAGSVDIVVNMHAGVEVGGVACRSFQHTQVLLLALEQRLLASGRDLVELVRATSDATTDLIERRHEWVPELGPLLNGPMGAHVVAPFRRLAAAQQSALMLREGPRRPAVACETGDWSHVDVYLTKSTDYRMLLLTGSRWEPELLRWCAERSSTVVAVGADVPGVAASLRYRGDGDDDVRALTDTLVAELIAADWWLHQPSPLK